MGALLQPLRQVEACAAMCRERRRGPGWLGVWGLEGGVPCRATCPSLPPSQDPLPFLGVPRPPSLTCPSTPSVHTRAQETRRPPNHPPRPGCGRSCSLHRRHPPAAPPACPAVTILRARPLPGLPVPVLSPCPLWLSALPSLLSPSLSPPPPAGWVLNASASSLFSCQASVLCPSGLGPWSSFQCALAGCSSPVTTLNSVLPLGNSAACISIHAMVLPGPRAGTPRPCDPCHEASGTLWVSHGLRA